MASRDELLFLDGLEVQHERHAVDVRREGTVGWLESSFAAVRCWRVDACSKRTIGYQGRLWQGCHRNTFLIMLAYGFLAWTKWTECQSFKLPGRPRSALSTSEGSPAQILGIYAWTHVDS
jgi:hypothetical protein